MRKTFYDILEELEFNVLKEYENLLYLFAKEESIHVSAYFYDTLCESIDKLYFRSLPFRKHFTSIRDMMNALKLYNPSNNLDKLFVFCEFLKAVMPTNMNMYPNLKRQSEAINGNINNILECTNHEFIRTPDDKNKYIIIEKNKAATLSAQIVDNKDVAFEILEYNHYALKGNLSKKRQILVSISVYIEPILKEKLLASAGYKDLESNVGFLLNKFNIRHNNKEGKTAQDYIVSISDTELEIWYDRTYDMLIQAILTNENIAVENEISQLKKEYKWK